MPLRKLISDYQNGEMSEYLRRRLRTRSTVIACIECDQVFFDNVSLILHFGCHIKDDVLIPSPKGRDLASLRSPLSFTSPLYPPSSVGIRNEASMAFPRMNRPCPTPVSSAITSNPTPGDASLVDIPVLNSMPPLNSSFGTRLDVSQPIHRPMMSPYGLTSSSSPSLMYYQSGLRSFAHGFAAATRLQSQSVGYGRFANLRIPRINQIEKPIPEIIVISDDDEDDGKNVEEIDLTLKL